jgi:hypothetical protein
MASLFSTPKPPKIAPAPTTTDPNVQAAAAAQRAAAASATGRMSTILTSGLGDTSTPMLQTKELLGV